MRVPKTWVPILTRRIVDSLISREMIQPKIPVEKLLSEAEAIITEELMVEDRLNDEVKDLLRRHESDIERGRMDYRKLFELTKQKLVRERNLVL